MVNFKRIQNMRQIPCCIILFLSCSIASAESRVWTMVDGRTFEAKFVSHIAGKVSLRKPRGKLLKIPHEQFSEADLTFIQLEMPPRLDINFSKKSKQRVFPDSLSDLPRSSYFDFAVTIKQTSTTQYDQELIAEYFAIGDEIDGDKNILLDYQKKTFFLSKKNKRTVEFSGKTVELLDYVIGKYRRGDKFGGYLVVVTDARGEIIIHKASSKYFYSNLENLRMVPVSKYFDKTCSRVEPTRPKRFY